MYLRAASCALVAAGLVSLASSSFAACDAKSGPRRAALVELYTSEGCSSCPPADARLSRLGEALDAQADAVPLALHVGYWDYLGWVDPYAQRGFADRQSWLVRANRQRTVYTPQFFVNGTELPLTRTALRDEVRRVNRESAATTIRLQARPVAEGTLLVAAEASAEVSARRDSLALYVALAESGLVSKVARGENAGAMLAHDHVVRRWLGPARLTGDAARLEQDIAIPAAWNRARLELIAFVQDERTGEVLQALRTTQCTLFP
jgi:hypothetical protein